MKKFRKILFLAGALAIFGASCDKEDAIETNDFTEFPSMGLHKYVITVTPIGTTGIADILLTSDYLDRGSITTAGNGIEQDGSYRYYLTHKGRFFSLLYGQGNPGAVTTYRMNASGKLVKTTDFQTETVQVFTKVNDELLLMKVPRSGTETCNLYRIDALKSRIAGSDSINIVKLAANGERAHFTWATQVGDKVFAPYMSIKGCCSDAFGTVYPDSTWIAVLSYPGLKLEKVIRDNRTSYLGAYFNNGLAVTDNGDIYGYSPAAATNSSKYISKNPSAMVRILKGTTEFDKSYFFNVQEKSGGYHIAAQTYLTGSKFLLAMYGEPNAFPATRKMALVDVETQSFAWIKGMPDEILSITAPYNNNTISEDGNTGFIGLNTSTGSWVYAIDIATATARKGLTVEGGKITAITKVDY
ncbi:hypothetical protein J2T02_004600 [Chitinophaga terrae (ex Kim and Jung 2007)]|jgi:hypothetical protein|uniref:DUF4374 domain-containing protein n=1 Tax=Chitinophaga terrae (ex Kim and Jung 2007) TaxID=408074 RepID=UPI0027869A3E|nr:DUF4374 domain-containing protein [Chitinophaga terrae (ex Kim and Jung 2007)]MDQ0109456.1 hypothetical protein [Chitinophaga terrae (ex Kim and Jung 2007)]